MFSFYNIKPNDDDWHQIESCYDSSVFHSREWSRYLSKTIFKPYIVKIFESGINIGFFIGVRFGLVFHNIAAPVEGTGTYTQGLCFINPVSIEFRLSVYKELSNWIFNSKQAILFQVDDWQMKQDFSSWVAPDSVQFSEIVDMGGSVFYRPTLYVDLCKKEEELWASLSYKSCKYCINKAKKEGLRINIINQFDDIERFTHNHHRQLVDVCKRHGTHPRFSQSQKRMQKLCESLFPNRVLMVEVVGNDNQGKAKTMSSGIFCYDKGEGIYFSGASEQKFMKYCPNELMVWEAMRILHDRDAGSLNFGGIASYKLKFGTTYAYVPRIFFYKYPFIYNTKIAFFNAYHSLRRLFTKH